jgi:hypothetical protein
LPISPDGLSTTALWSSRDGGCTWSGRRLGAGGRGHVISANQHTAWDCHGDAYYVEVQQHNLDAGLLDHRILVWRSTDDGRTWDAPVTAVSALRDRGPADSSYAALPMLFARPRLAVDCSGGQRDGTVYITYETSFELVELPAEVHVVSSTDQGRTWSHPRRVDAGTYETQFIPRHSPVVDARGTLFVVYVHAPITVTPLPGEPTGRISLRVARSTTGGASFDRMVVDPDIHRIGSPDEGFPFFTETIPALAADPRRPGHLAVAWAERINAFNSRIFLRVSAHGGATWTKRIDVADDPASVPDQHDHATLAYSPGGRLFVAWRDRRCCRGGWSAPFQVWVRGFRASRRDGAMTGGRTVQLTSGPQVPATGRRGSAVLPAAIMALVATRRSVLASWDQLGGALSENVFRRVPIAAFDGPACVRRSAWTGQHTPGPVVVSLPRASLPRCARPRGGR